MQQWDVLDRITGHWNNKSQLSVHRIALRQDIEDVDVDNLWYYYLLLGTLVTWNFQDTTLVSTSTYTYNLEMGLGFGNRVIFNFYPLTVLLKKKPLAVGFLVPADALLYGSNKV